MKHNVVALKTTEKYLTITVSTDYIGAKRLSEIKVPMVDLAQTEVHQVLSQHLQAELRRAWDLHNEMSELTLFDN